MEHISTVGDTDKSHKSRKMGAHTSPDGGPSSTGLAGVLQPDPTSHDVIPQEIPEKQWWWREKDSKSRKLAERIFVLKARGLRGPQIAKKLDISEGTVRTTMYLARKNGWVDGDDEPIDLELDLALTVDRKIVRNISAALDGQMTNWQTHEMTIAAAKGRGHFKNHEVSKAEGGAGLAMVAIKVVMPPVGAGDQMVVEGNIGGTPSYLDAEYCPADGEGAGSDAGMGDSPGGDSGGDIYLPPAVGDAGD